MEVSELSARGGAAKPFPGLDVSFFVRVYRTSAWVAILTGMLVMEWLGWRVSAGIVAGTIISMLSMMSVEWTVRLLFNGGSHSSLKLAAAAVLKFPLILGLLVPTAWAAYNGHLNIFAVVAGVVLVHAVLIGKFLGAAYCHYNVESNQG